MMMTILILGFRVLRTCWSADVKKRSDSILTGCNARCLIVYGYEAKQALQSRSLPRPVHLSGTIRKYLFMASVNRVLYSSGDTTVGILPWPPRIPLAFTYISNFLSHVKVRIKSAKTKTLKTSDENRQLHQNTLTVTSMWLCTMAHFTVVRPGHWIETRPEVTLFCYKLSWSYYLHANKPM